MQEHSMQRRTMFIIELLSETKTTYEQLTQTIQHLGKCTDSYYKKVLEEDSTKLKNEVNTYKSNISRIKHLNAEITSAMNTWYVQVKDSGEMKKLLYPVMLYFKKKKLDKEIKEKNDTIASLLIENRFIKERVTHLEHELELKAIAALRQGEEYQCYERLLKKKDALIQELTYILPTLPDLCPLEIDLANIDVLIEKLTSLTAA